MRLVHPRLSRTDAVKVERPSGRGHSPSRHLLTGLALASVLPCAALIWPDTIPREIEVLALIAWAGIFAVVAWFTSRTEPRSRRRAPPGREGP